MTDHLYPGRRGAPVAFEKSNATTASEHLRDAVLAYFVDGHTAPAYPAIRSEEPPSFEVDRLPWAKCSRLEHARLRRAYRSWWVRELGTPYGLCGCGCEQKTRKAGWTGRARGYVSGEPLPFLPRHRERWGFPELTNPHRLCACGCGRKTPVVRRGNRDDAGRPREFAGGRAEYLSRDHRPPEYAPLLTLTTPLGDPADGTPAVSLTDEEMGWLSQMVCKHLSFVRDRGRVRPKIHLVDESAVLRFHELTRRGRVYPCEPSREGDGCSSCWTTRSPLEAANLLLRLEAHKDLDEASKHTAEVFLERYGFLDPASPESRRREESSFTSRGRQG